MRGDLGRLLVVALQIEDHAHRRRIAHERAVALVGLDDEQVRASGPGIARQALRPGAGADSPPVITEGSRPAPRRISNTIAVTVDLPLVPVTAMVRWVATKWASSSERWTMGMPARLRRRHVGHLLLDRGRDDERGAIGAETRCRPAAGRRCRGARALPAAPLARPGRRRGRCRSRGRPVITWNWASALMPEPPSPA